MRNLNNKLKLKRGKRLMFLTLTEGISVAIPTPLAKKDGRNVVMVLDVAPDGSFSAHWEGNFNTFGDFRSELMVFNNDLVLDKQNEKARKDFREKAGLINL